MNKCISTISYKYHYVHCDGSNKKHKQRYMYKTNKYQASQYGTSMSQLYTNSIKLLHHNHHIPEVLVPIIAQLGTSSFQLLVSQRKLEARRSRSQKLEARSSSISIQQKQKLEVLKARCQSTCGFQKSSTSTSTTSQCSQAICLLFAHEQ